MLTMKQNFDRRTQPRDSVSRTILGVALLGMAVFALTPSVRAQEPKEHSAGATPGQGHMQGNMQGRMQGMMGQGGQDMQTIHALFGAHQQIKRTVKKLPNGVETMTESEVASVQVLLKEHVGAMYNRLATNQPIRQWDPLYAELFKQAGKIKMEILNTPKGIRVIETSTDPWVVSLLQAHAEGVSEFVNEGMAAMHKEHPLPAATSEKTMQILSLKTTIGAGKDKQVEQLFQGPGRRLIQITLRNAAILDAHKAAVPITIQCVAGHGTLKLGDGTPAVELTPGVLVTIEPNIVHEVSAQSAVSILLTQFTDK
jgi:quercetin dioxygenase-like cupin family protein